MNIDNAKAKFLKGLRKEVRKKKVKEGLGSSMRNALAHAAHAGVSQGPSATGIGPVLRAGSTLAMHLGKDALHGVKKLVPKIKVKR